MSGYEFYCVDCTRGLPREFATECKYCGGLVDVRYAALRSGAAGECELPLLPLADGGPKLLAPLGEKNRTWRSDALARWAGVEELWVKDETRGPTRTTKDRMAVVALASLVELGVEEFVVTSTGNTSTAFAHLVSQRPELRMHVFAGRDFFHRCNWLDVPNISVYRVDSDFVQAGRVAQEFAKDQGIPFEGGFFNVARREGLKTAYQEAFLAGCSPDYVFQAISSGMGLYGGIRGGRELVALGLLDKLPRFVGAQQASCAPTVAAHEGGHTRFPPELIIESPTGLAASILRGNPTRSYPYLREAIMGTGGTFVSVPTHVMHEAKAALADAGLLACYASAVALGAVRRLRVTGAIHAAARVLVNVTGGERLDADCPVQFVELTEHGQQVS
jgi:threonine synthase